MSPPKPVTPTKPEIPLNIRLPWLDLPEETRIAIRRKIRDLIVARKGRDDYPDSAAGICANLTRQSRKNHPSLEHVVDALREMETQGIVTSYIGPKGVEIWEVKR